MTFSPIVSNHFGVVVKVKAAFPLGPQRRDGAAVVAAADGHIVVDLEGKKVDGYMRQAV